MSAIGSGVTLLFSDGQLDGEAPLNGSAGATRPAMEPVVLNVGQQLVLSHYVGRRAWQIIFTSTSGNILTTSAVSAQQTLGVRPAPDTITITNNAPDKIMFFASIRWQEPSAEANTISTSSPMVVIEQQPG